MKQNKYDEPEFFANYTKMRRSISGLDDAQEWHAFRALFADLHNKRLLDLGCGFGWHCRYARQQQARSVVGVDLSEKMLCRALGSLVPKDLPVPRIQRHVCAFGRTSNIHRTRSSTMVLRAQGRPIALAGRRLSTGGPRHTQWMADDVVKYHRTVATYVNTLINSGFRISKLSEPEPTP